MDYIYGSVSLETEPTNNYGLKSRALYQILEDSGASIDIRNMWRETFASCDIMETVCNPKYVVYYFGSSREGTTTTDMNPDTDKVNVSNIPPVTINCSNDLVESLLLVHDNDTRSGYRKLQLVFNGNPLFENGYGTLTVNQHFRREPFEYLADKYNRLVVVFNSDRLIESPGAKRHGPAIFQSDSRIQLTKDIVYAFNGPLLPSCVAAEWITRPRNYNWPPKDVIDHCETLGCLLVPVGHPSSDEKDLEWRLSLSHQERLLVSLFNSVQHKCYILLKLWKKDVLPLWIGQESLTSYHCKTCMFYMIENTPSVFWRPDNLLGCFVACLKLFLFWTTKEILPNYFIPAENMFDGKINPKLQYSLLQALQEMLTQDCLNYLSKISTSRIGNRVLACSSNSQLNSVDVQHSMYIKSKAQLAGHLKMHTFRFRLECMQHLQAFCCSDNPQQFHMSLYEFSQRLKHTTRITEHTAEETQRATSCIIPYLDLIIRSCAIEIQKSTSREEIWRFLSDDKWHQLSLKTDISAKLKQASLMYMFGYYCASLDVLSSIEICHISSVCRCYKKSEMMAVPTNSEMCNVCKNQPGIGIESMVFHLFLPCIVFLPVEKNTTPDALCYEMLRYQGDPPGHTDDLVYDLQKCAVIDGRFLFHFLLYLNHSKLNMSSNVSTDIDKMKLTIDARNDSNDRPKCCHREACLNILGWVYKDQGCVEKAVECFKRSLEVKPRGNAATWHLLLILCNRFHGNGI